MYGITKWDRIRWKWTRVKWWFRAMHDDPTWPLCRWCYWRLLMADDVGWFCLFPEKSPDPGGLTCEHCFRYGEAGRRHHDRHGWGDR